MHAWFGPVAVLTGLLWGLRGGVALADPQYWSPRTALDYTAVTLFSAALISLAMCVWWLRLVPSRLVSFGGGLATAGLLAAGIANLIEDGMGLRALGIIYVSGAIVGTLALIPLGIGLLRQGAPRWPGALVLVTVAGLLGSSTWLGSALLAGAWMVAGVTVMRRGLLFAGDDPVR